MCNECLYVKPERRLGDIHAIIKVVVTQQMSHGHYSPGDHTLHSYSLLITFLTKAACMQQSGKPKHAPLLAQNSSRLPRCHCSCCARRNFSGFLSILDARQCS